MRCWHGHLDSPMAFLPPVMPSIFKYLYSRECPSGRALHKNWTSPLGLCTGLLLGHSPIRMASHCIKCKCVSMVAIVLVHMECICAPLGGGILLQEEPILKKDII